jgi:hypothetical protein
MKLGRTTVEAGIVGPASLTGLTVDPVEEAIAGADEHCISHDRRR